MSKAVQTLQDLLRDEIKATRDYECALECLPVEMHSIIEEIRRDEINHQGRLLNLILRTDESQQEAFKRGLEQQE